MTDFWRNWLTIACGAVVLFGLVMIGAGFPATDAPAAALLERMNPAATITFDEPLRFTTGLIGAVTLGWGMTLLATVRAADRLGEAGRPVWRLTAASLLIWYVIDSAISIATGFALNAVSNTVLTAAFLLPMLRLGLLGEGAPRGSRRTA